MRRSRWVMLVVIPVLVVGAAATAYAVAPGHKAPAALVLDGVVCPMPRTAPADGSWGDPAITPGSLPDGFVPVAAVECPQMLVAGVDPATLEIRHEGDLRPLLAALAMRDARSRPANCTAEMNTPPLLWLVDARGRAALMHVPVSVCRNEDKPATEQALAHLKVVHHS